MFDWIASSFEGTPAQREFLHVLQAAVAGHPPDDAPADWASVLTLASAHQVAFYLYPLVRTWSPPSNQPRRLRHAGECRF